MVVAVMVSMVAFLDSTVINLALPATPTCALRHRGVVPRPAGCATRPGRQPLGHDQNITSARLFIPSFGSVAAHYSPG
jgi:hypothetical protein